MLSPSDLRLLSYTAWGNRVVLPTPYSSTGAIIRMTTGRGAHSNAAACCYSTKKAGIMPALLMAVRISVGDLCYGHIKPRGYGYVRITKAARGGVFVTNTAVEGAFDRLYNGGFYDVGA